MTLYRFFQVANKVGPLDVPTLYAITNKKELAEGFEETRNMKFFRMKKGKISKEEYMVFADKYKNYILGMRSFQTRSENALIKYDYIELVATGGEEEFVYIQSDKVLTELGRFTRDESSGFNDSIIKALTTMDYFRVHQIYNDDNAYFSSGMEDFYNEDMDLGWAIDSLSLFIYYYGYTMKVTKKKDRNEV